MARTLTAVPLALLLVVATATGASAHAAFRERELPAQSEHTLTLRVPDERPGETTVAVEVLVPRPFEILDCPSDTEWTCEVGTDGQDRTILSWSRERGEGDAALTIDVRTPDEPGNSRWLTIQTYDSGTEVAWNQRSEEERPAPLLTVVEPGAPVVETTDDPADHGTEVEGEAIVPTDTLPPTEPAATDFTPPVEPTEDLATTAPAQPGATDPPTPPGGPDDGGGIGFWGVVALLLILAAGLGAARMVRRGPAGGVPGGATEDPYDPEA